MSRLSQIIQRVDSRWTMLCLVAGLAVWIANPSQSEPPTNAVNQLSPDGSSNPQLPRAVSNRTWSPPNGPPTTRNQSALPVSATQRAAPISPTASTAVSQATDAPSRQAYLRQANLGQANLGRNEQIPNQTQTGFPQSTREIDRRLPMAETAGRGMSNAAPQGEGIDPAQLLQVMGKASDSAGGVGAAGGVIGFSHSDGSGTLTITLVDTGKSSMAVYHISRSGEIHLVSSRPIDADFSLLLNATSPTPGEISAMSGFGK